MPIITTEPPLLETALGKIVTLFYLVVKISFSFLSLLLFLEALCCFNCHHPSNSYHLVLPLTRFASALIIHFCRWRIGGHRGGLPLVGWVGFSHY